MPSTIEVPPLTRRAAVSTINEADRTVRVVFSTGQAVERRDWHTGGSYLEKLSLKPGAVRLARLNTGAPLLDSHRAGSISDQIGGVQPGSAKVEGEQALATVRFSARAAVRPIWIDVVDGIIRAISVGYRIWAFEETPGKGSTLPVRLATDWEPFELSLCTIGADAGAQVLRAARADTNVCTLVQQRTLTVTDADRARRLRNAQARTAQSEPVRGPSWEPPSHLSAAHLRAFGDAIAKFTGKEKYSWNVQRHVLPDQFVGFRWDHPRLLNADSKAGETSFPGGFIVVDIRSDLSPAELHRTTLHELQHVVDWHFILGGKPAIWYEARARQTAERLGSI